MTALAKSLVQGLSAGGWPGLSKRIDWVIVLILALIAATVALDPDNAWRLPASDGDRGGVLTIAIAALAQTSLYIAIAVGLLAYLNATGADAMVSRAFTGNETRMIVLAALVGGLAPFCSCEVIPFIAGLLALSAPLSAVMAFWLSSPLMDPPTFLITAGALGWDYAIAKGVVAVGLGLAGGFILRGLVAGGAFAAPLRHAPKKSCCGGGGAAALRQKPVWRFWRDGARIATFRDTALTQAVFLLRWLALAYIIEGLMITYLPAEYVAQAVGGEGVLPIILSAFVGMPAYLNGYAAPALVSGLIEQGMQPGAALAFLVAGAVSSIPAMAAVWSLVKRPVFIAYLTLGLSGAIVSGLAFQQLVASGLIG